jgi:hypothetical protein
MLTGNPEAFTILKSSTLWAELNWDARSRHHQGRKITSLVGVFGNPRAATILGAFAALGSTAFVSFTIYMNFFKNVHVWPRAASFSCDLYKLKMFMLGQEPPVFLILIISYASTSLLAVSRHG